MQATVIEIIFALVQAQMPTALMILGGIFLLLAIVDHRTGEHIVRNVWVATFLGVFFIVLAIGIQTLPVVLEASGTATDPLPVIAEGADEPTSDPDDPPFVTMPDNTPPEDERFPAPACWTGPIATYPGFLEEEYNVPPAGETTLEVTVPPGEIHAITGGTAFVEGVTLSGGTDRGSVVVLLPGDVYTVRGLNPTYNWHGNFNLAPENGAALAKVLAAQQMTPGTCSDRNGCSIVDVLVLGPEGVISQSEEHGPLVDGCLP